MGGPGHVPIRLAVIVASVRERRFGPTVAAWLVGEVEGRADLALDAVDLAEVPPGPAFRERVDAAEAFVVVTPEYNHGYPGPLKTAIDSANAEWYAKPIGLVSYGGRSGGLRAAEQLRQVFCELHCMTIRESISFHGGRRSFGEDGRPHDPAAGAAARSFLDQLVWWALALREARTARPYAG